MRSAREKSINVCRQICMLADEMRDTWLQQQSRSRIREIMSLTISQQRMLRTVWRMKEVSPQGVMLKELANSLSLSCSAVSVMVDAMVRRGVLERATDACDRRKIFIRVTDSGLHHAKLCEEGIGSIGIPFFDGVPEEKIDKVMEFLDEFQEFFTNIKKENEK